MVLGERKVVMRIQPAMVRAAQGVERSEFEHDRLLKRGLMANIIYQELIDKKRKKCLNTIDKFDICSPRNVLGQPSLHRISQ
jgi:hypothetical protein